MIDALATVQEDEWEADHLGAAGRLLADQKRRSLVVWITDVAETAMTPDVVRAASRLLQRHVVLFVVIGQPDLRALADRVPQTVPDMYDTAATQEVLHRRERPPGQDLDDHGPGPARRNRRIDLAEQMPVERDAQEHAG